MRVVLAPDCFTGTLTAGQAAEALRAGWAAVRPGDALVPVPLSDGGPGFVDALPGVRRTALVQDPLGRVTAATFVLDGATAYVEAAEAAGLHLLAPGERDPGVTTTHGVGELVRAAVAAGATRVVVGLGGTGTNDGGAGLLAALGLEALDATGSALPPGGLALRRACGLVGQVSALELVAATDVEDVLLGPQGASAGYGPQKGATPAQVVALEEALAHWADLLEAHLGVAVRARPGAGAAGGLGFALLALGAQRVSGFDLVAHALQLDDQIAAADLVVTGEGRLDGSSTRGKVVAGVSRLAAEHGVPCVALAGEVLLGEREARAAGLAATWSLRREVGEQALTRAAWAVSEVAGRIARGWGVAQ